MRNYVRPRLKELKMRPFIAQLQTGTNPGPNLIADCDSGAGGNCEFSALYLDCIENTAVLYSLFLEGPELTGQQVLSLCDIDGININEANCDLVTATPCAYGGSINGFVYSVYCPGFSASCPASATISCQGYNTSEPCFYTASEPF